MWYGVVIDGAFDLYGLGYEFPTVQADDGDGVVLSRIVVTVTGCAIGDSDSISGVPSDYVFSDLVLEQIVSCDKFSDK